jgi:hypothetical protein
MDRCTGTAGIGQIDKPDDGSENKQLDGKQISRKKDRQIHKR